MRLPRLSGSEIASMPTSSVTPFSSVMGYSLPRSMPYRYGTVGSTEMSPKSSRCCWNSFVGPGNSSRLRVS